MKASSKSNKKKGPTAESQSLQVPFEVVVNPLGDGVICVDNAWRYTYLNDAALPTHPLGRQATLGQSIWDIHPEMKGTIFWDKYHEAMETKKVVEVESHYAPMNTWFFAKVYPSANGLTILYMDITLRKRAEQEILTSRSSQQAILENTTDSIWSIDEKYHLLFCNSKFRTFITSHTGKEIQLGDDLRAFIPEDHRNLISLCKRGLDGEKFSIEQSKEINGKLVVEELFFNPIQSDERISGVSVFVHDITKRRKAEADYEQSELRYETLVEELSDAVFVSDETGRYTDVNPSACRLLGYTRDELLLMQASDIVYSESAKKNLPSRFDKLRTGKADITENRLRRKDGSAVEVEVNARMLYDGRFVGIVRDITDRKKAQEALDKRERRFRAMIENSDDIIALVDKDLRTLYTSPSAERITGYSLEDSMGGLSRNNTHPDDLANSGDVLRQAFSTSSKPLPLQFRIKHKEGHYIWLEGTLTNMFHDPNVNALVFNLRDVTVRALAQEKILANERRFRALIENITDGIVLNDEHSNLLFQSNSVERILGYSWTERQGMAVTNFIHPDNEKAFRSLYEELRLNPGRPYPFQYRFRHKNGYYIWLEGVVTNLLNEPTVGAYVANYRDITDRKEAEDKLNSERSLLRTLIDNLPDLIYVKDHALRYLANNKSQLELMGVRTQEETIGKTAVDIYGPESAQPYHKDDENLIRTGIAVTDREEMILDAGGQPKFLLSTKVPLRGANGEVVGLVGISRDITKQKQIELALRNSNYFLESAQRAGKIGYWISELSGENKLIWSAETCKIFGVAQDQFDGRAETFYNLIHPGDRDEVREASAFAISHREPYAVDHRIILQDGTQKWVHEQGEVTLDERGSTIQLLGIVQDISERKRAEQEILELNVDLEMRVKIRTEQLQTANKEMEAFTYSVSHDLRSPLRIIDGYAQIFLEDYHSKVDEEGQRSLRVIMSNAKKMGKLIDDLLEFSRIGRAEIKKSSVNMKEAVGEVLEELKLGGVRMPAEIHIERMATALCDPNLIRHVWLNLISNAIKYSGGNAHAIVEVGCGEFDGKMAYYVKDNGAGFDMQYYNKLFGVFQRLHSHHEFTGTGVGLAIVQRIIAKHGGNIWAQSRVNEGATFYFSLE